MSEHFDQTIVIIDGLEEFRDETEDVVDMIREVADYSKRVSMALFSSDPLSNRSRLDQDCEIIPIAAQTEDVRLFVVAELEKRIRARRLQLNDSVLCDYGIAICCLHRPILPPPGAPKLPGGGCELP